MKQTNNHHFDPPISPSKRLLVSILRIFFKLLYHQLAWTYDWIAYIVSLGTWRAWVRSVLPYLSGPRILEVGFGPGHLQVALLQKGISVFGLDESTQMARISYRRIKEQGLYPNLARGFAQNLPFACESIHQIVLTFPAEFIFNPQTLIEVRRVLVKGGEAVIVPFPWITGHHPLHRLVAWLFRVTGETPEWDDKYLAPLKNEGFEISWKMIEFTSSKVLLIQLIKPLLP